jgi:hypothetical protein
MASPAKVRRVVLVAGVAGMLLAGCATGSEPEIPSCPACELRMAVFGGTGRVRGTFSPVDTSVFVETRVVINSGSTTVPLTPLPTGGAYDSSVTVGATPSRADLQFRYRTSIGELRWTSKAINLPVRSAFSAPRS